MLKKDDIARKIQCGECELVVIETSPEDPISSTDLPQLPMREVVRFVNRAGDAVVILAPLP